jgi:hypothetical protein
MYDFTVEGCFTQRSDSFNKNKSNAHKYHEAKGNHQMLAKLQALLHTLQAAPLHDAEGRTDQDADGLLLIENYHFFLDAYRTRYIAIEESLEKSINIKNSSTFFKNRDSPSYVLP